MLGRQIAGKPIDAAILQMVFSEKRASTRIKSMLCVARDHAEQYKNLDRSKLIVGMSSSSLTTLKNFIHRAQNAHSPQPNHGYPKARNWLE